MKKEKKKGVLARILQYVGKYPFALIGSILFSLLSVGATLFIPVFFGDAIDCIMETGVDALNPLEVKAGMDALAIKKQYGDRLVLQGGINAVNWGDAEEIVAEIREKVPVLKENGGYIFASDHSIPNNVSLENMKRIVAAAKETGRY